jgi:hypothetical protein
MLLAITLLGRRVQAFATHWHHLIEALCHPYRPELHYMRGRGPKWRARHRRMR